MSSTQAPPCYPQFPHWKQCIAGHLRHFCRAHYGFAHGFKMAPSKICNIWIKKIDKEIISCIFMLSMRFTLGGLFMVKSLSSFLGAPTPCPDHPCPSVYLGVLFAGRSCGTDRAAQGFHAGRPRSRHRLWNGLRQGLHATTEPMPVSKAHRETTSVTPKLNIL